MCINAGEDDACLWALCCMEMSLDPLQAHKTYLFEVLYLILLLFFTHGFRGTVSVTVLEWKGLELCLSLSLNFLLAYIHYAGGDSK
jgi:hypothetical protein